jgi:predicted phosphohydrolase
MKVQIQCVSDLHIDCLLDPVGRWRSLIEPSAPYLALVGDLCSLSNKELWCEFVAELQPHWQHIFIVNGNHEYYADTSCRHDNYPTMLDNQREWVRRSGYTNVHILENDSYELEDVMILGCTLWSRVPVWAEEKVATTINDYRRIFCMTAEGYRNIDVRFTNALHEKSVRWLYDKISKSEKYVIVLTHYAPLVSGTSDPKYENDKDRALNHAFATDLSGLISLRPEILLWVFGHTHWYTDMMFKHCRVVSNPRGYDEYAEPRYENNKVVEISTE